MHCLKSGNSDSEQETKQSQSSDQDGQVVLGDSSILSGNNLQCQNQYNADENGGDEDLCSPEGTNNPTPPQPPNGEAVLTTASILRANSCNIIVPPCPTPNGHIVIFDETAHQLIARYSPSGNGDTPVYFYNSVPIGHTVRIAGDETELGNIHYYPDAISIDNLDNGCSDAASADILANCTFVMGPGGAAVGLNWYYGCRSIFCGGA